MATDWVEFDDAPKRRLIRERLRRTWPFILALGTGSAFLSKGGSSPFAIWGWTAVLVWFLGWGVVLVVAWGVLHLTGRPLAVDEAGRRVRIRTRVHPFSAIDVAEVSPADDEQSHELSFRFGVHGRRKVSVLLRDGTDVSLTGAQRAALLAMIDGSSIGRPTSPYDPDGRFGRFNFPGTLDKAGAAEVVARPPVSGQLGP